MATNLFLVSLHTKLLFPRTKPLLKSPIFSFSLFSSSASSVKQTQTLSLSQFSEPSFFYGPSLDRGTVPSQSKHQKFQKNEEGEDGNGEVGAGVVDRDSFTRVFELSALRVPSRDCFAIENRLRGHLLNWPRIRNVARVAGDEMEEEFVKLVGEKGNGEGGEDGEDLDALNRRIYGQAEGDGEDLGPVLYRDKLAKTFNSRGFVKFRNLAKLSRPNKKKRKEGEERVEKKKGPWKNDIFMVEVVEDEDEDWSGLLGDDFKGRKWRGSTRLLLLDERYWDRSIEDLPEAIKVVFEENNRESRTPKFELVRCKLTLFYDYWQMNEILKALLPASTLIPSTFETVGHIAHLNLREELLPYKRLIAQVVLDKNKAKVRTVVNKIDPIDNEYRTMHLEVLAGNHSLVTTVVENGLRFQVDFANVYWNSRLATERQRLMNGFTHKDVVCDVFAGVGPIAIAAGKIVKCVYANDLNPQAVEYLERNTLLNKVERKVKVYNMDGRRFIDSIFKSEQTRPITQVVMNLPNSAVDYLDMFKGIFREAPKDKELILPKIHVYGFSRASDPEFDFHERIRIALSEVAVDVEMRVVRDVAPGKPMLCASFILPESVAFAKPSSEKQS